jgi:hypothetical protein
MQPELESKEIINNKYYNFFYLLYYIEIKIFNIL